MELDKTSLQDKTSLLEVSGGVSRDEGLGGEWMGWTAFCTASGRPVKGLVGYSRELSYDTAAVDVGQNKQQRISLREARLSDSASRLFQT